MRYLSESIQKDLSKKMVVLSGPRQSGKTTLAKGLCDKTGEYLNWDIRSHQKIIRDIAWDKSSSLVVLDEVHKYNKWKNFLKGVVDEFQNTPPLLVTGSAKLETFRKQGDALTGRFFHYRLHPIDYKESKTFLPKLSKEKRIERLLNAGGFPESFLNPDESERLRNNRFDLVLQEDLRDLSKSNSIRGLQLLIEILRERAGSLIQYANLAVDLGVSPATVKSWIELLERLYIVFPVMPYTKGFSRSLRSPHKLYFYDSSAPYQDSAKLENLVACYLLKWIHFKQDTKGIKGELCFFRDREKREVDFVVLENRSVKQAIEVKTKDDSLSPHLQYFQERTNANCYQWIFQANRVKEIQGLRIMPLAQGMEEWK